MKNPRLVQILNTSVMENRQDQEYEKLSVISDIMKSKKLLFGYCTEGRREFIESPGTAFNVLYDQSLEELTKVHNELTTKIKSILKPKH